MKKTKQRMTKGGNWGCTVDRCTVAELSKFNVRAANEHYKVKKEDSLEAILLALHLPGDKVDFDLS